MNAQLIQKGSAHEKTITHIYYNKDENLLFPISNDHPYLIYDRLSTAPTDPSNR